jgi:tripartite-type tricarboxylate transporter receptor subunit TctC
MKDCRFAVRVWLVASLLAISAGVQAQSTYPDKPIRMLIPFAAGGATDLHGRMLAQRMQPILKQTIVVEAKAGASGIIATQEVIRARPDGYTMLLSTSSTLIVAPAGVKEPPYDALKDLATVAIIGVQPTAIIASSDFPAKTMKDLVALLKANPGKYSYGAAGTLSVNTLMMEMFKKQAGNVSLELIPFKGTNEVVAELLAGRLPLAALTSTGVLDLYRAGRIKVLAVVNDSRIKSAPDIPTAVEQGFPDLVVVTFNAISLPGATPRPILNRLNQVIVSIMASDSYAADLDKLGMELFSGSTSEQATRFIASLAAKWTPAIRDLAAQQ